MQSAIRERFEQHYALYKGKVWAVAYARWLDGDTAMDIVQETFLRLWKQLETGEELQNPRAWLLRVARNLAEDFAKSAFRRNGTQSPETLGAVLARGDGPLDGLERGEAFEQIRKLVEDLPQADREVLTMKYALDYEATDIAESLGIAVSAVHMRLSRARQRLAEQLSAHGVTTIP